MSLKYSSNQVRVSIYFNNFTMKNIFFVIVIFAFFTNLKADNLDTIANTIVIDTSAIVCAGESFLGYTVTGIYVDTLIQNNTCTIRTLDLTVHTQTDIEWDLICVQESDPNYTVGTFSETRIDSNGCEFVHNTIVDIQFPDIITLISLCEGESFIFNGIIMNETRIYTIDMFDMGPCSYAQVFDVTIVPVIREETVAIICEGESYEWNGIIYTESGDYVNPIGSCEDQYLILNIVPLDECVGLEILVYEDLNGNCIHDLSEPGLENMKVNIDKAITRSTDVNGSAIVVLGTGMHTVSLEFDSKLYNSCISSHIIDLDSIDKIIYIPVEVIDECADVLLGTSMPLISRCNENRYYIETFNKGTGIAKDVIVHITLDQEFEGVNSTMELISVSNSIYTYSIGDILARENIRNYVDFKLSCDVALNQSHCISAEIEYNNSCTILSNTPNTIECRENNGSSESNNKSIYVDGIANKDVIDNGSEIEYLIKFQNTGSDTVSSIRIEDEISLDFDINSLTPISSSHDYQWSIERSRKLTVDFEDIMLLDSTMNESESHGFIKFSVSLRDAQFEPGDIITNTASIYFDDTDPVITNTVETAYICRNKTTQLQTTICEGEEYEGYTFSGFFTDDFVSELGCDSTRTLELTVLPFTEPDCLVNTTEIASGNIVIYPVPASDLLHINITDNEQLTAYRIFDLNGLLVQEESFRNYINTQHSLSTTRLNAGMYIISLRTKNNKNIERKVVISR